MYVEVIVTSPFWRDFHNILWMHFKVSRKAGSTVATLPVVAGNSRHDEDCFSSFSFAH